MLNWTRKDALLACKRCPFEVQLSTSLQASLQHTDTLQVTNGLENSVLFGF